MICDLCGKNEAEIFFEQKSVKDNSVVKISLCRACATSHGIKMSQIVYNENVVSSLFKEILTKRLKERSDLKKLCPGCGKSLYDIIFEKKAGCPECYSVFTEDIKKSFPESRFSEKYNGSFPRRVKDFRNALTDRADLQAKLEKAVKEEDYEKAAVYRDFLRALEKTSVSKAD